MFPNDADLEALERALAACTRTRKRVWSVLVCVQLTWHAALGVIESAEELRRGGLSGSQISQQVWSKAVGVNQV